MTIELTDHEAKEVVLALRYFYDASVDHLPISESGMHVYVSVISKLQEGLGLSSTSPWEKPENYEEFL
jgi:hypothetical protein